MNVQSQKPCLCGSIILVFRPTICAKELLNLFPPGTTCDEYPDCIEITYLQKNDIYSWEVDDLLTSLFSTCNLSFISDITSRFQGKVIVDITFHHFDVYPALVFEGTNMEIIRKLNADISIDPY